ncbi:MAG: MFS transporter [Verrucomicrobiota bacterium]
MEAVLDPVPNAKNKAPLTGADAPPALPDRPVAARRAVAALFFLNGALFATWVSRLPAMETARSLSHAQLGLALLVIAVGAVISMPLTGALSSRVGTAFICRATVVSYCLILPLLAVVPGIPLWCLMLLLFGMAHGALDVAMNAQAVAVEKRYPHPVMSVFHALFSTGGLAGAAAGGLLASLALRPEIHFTLVAAVMAVMALAAFPHLISKDLSEAATMAVDPSTAEAAVIPPGPSTDAESAGKKSRRLPFRMPSRHLAALGIVGLCVMMGEGAMADWTAVYLRRIVGTSEGLAAAGYAAFSIAMAAGRFTGDFFAHRFGPVNLVRGSALLATGGIALALLAPHPAAALTGFALVGAGFATVVPMVFSAAGRTPGISPGVALASVTTIGYLGFLLGPPVIGFAAEVIGLRSALGLIALTSLLPVFLAGAVRRGD